MRGGVLGALKDCRAACSQAQSFFEFLDLIFTAFQYHTLLSGLQLSLPLRSENKQPHPPCAGNQKTRKPCLLERPRNTVHSLVTFLVPRASSGKGRLLRWDVHVREGVEQPLLQKHRTLGEHLASPIPRQSGQRVPAGVSHYPQNTMPRRRRWP